MAYHQSSHRYGNCDSYFVEEDEGLYTMRAEARERARAVARMQQRALADELSRMTAEEYQEDVLDHMEHMEVRRLHPAAVAGTVVADSLHPARPRRCLTSTPLTSRPRSSGS